MRGIAISIALGLVVAACGSAQPRRTHSSPTQISQISTKAPRGLARSLSGQRVGTTQTVDTEGAQLAVTVRQVIDPLRGAGVRLPPDARAVGVLVQIRSAGPALYDSSATGDFRLVPAYGSATPVLARRGVCRTPTQDFDRYITSGEDRVGCVVFAVRRGDRVAGVRFDPHGHSRGRLTWTVAARP